MTSIKALSETAILVGFEIKSGEKQLKFNLK